MKTGVEKFTAFTDESCKFDRRNYSSKFNFPLIDSNGDKILFERRASNSSHLRRIEIKELKLSANEFDVYFKRNY